MLSATGKRHEEGVEMIDGIEVHYVKNPYANYMSTLRKLWSFLRFIRQAIQVAKKIKNVDLVYATSTPLTRFGTFGQSSRFRLAQFGTS